MDKQNGAYQIASYLSVVSFLKKIWWNGIFINIICQVSGNKKSLLGPKAWSVFIAAEDKIPWDLMHWPYSKPLNITLNILTYCNITRARRGGVGVVGGGWWLWWGIEPMITCVALVFDLLFQQSELPWHSCGITVLQNALLWDISNRFICSDISNRFICLDVNNIFISYLCYIISQRLFCWFSLKNGCRKSILFLFMHDIFL